MVRDLPVQFKFLTSSVCIFVLSLIVALCCTSQQRDGTDVLQDLRSGNVLAEILVKGQNGDYKPVVATFASPWKLGKS